MNTTLFNYCSPHCLPLLLVSLSDPTLTVKNVTEVMEVLNWKRVARGHTRYHSSPHNICHTYISQSSGLRIPYSKLEEFQQQSSSERDSSHAIGEYWINTYPDASWEMLADALYTEEEERAAVMVKRYLPKGMCIDL